MNDSSNLHGIFAGLVEKTEDPEKLGRLKVRVPSVYGSAGGQGSFIGVDGLPWALPAGLPAGGSPLSGGIDWLPTVGDQVFVMFLDGEPEKPVWMWGMQTKPQAKKFPLHSYGQLGGPVGKPDRGALTRYGHTIEWGPGTLIVTTSKGYRLSLSENVTMTGQCLLTTPMGNQFSLDDSTGSGAISVNLDMMINAMGQFSVLANSIDLTAMIGGISFNTPGPLTFSGVNASVGSEITLQSSLIGKHVAIGNSETELLRTLATLITALSQVSVSVSGVMPGPVTLVSAPLALSPAWLAGVQPALDLIVSITGVIEPEPGPVD